jgi:hypothetical protein
VNTVTLGDTDLFQRTVRGWNMLRTEWITRALVGADPAGLGPSRVAELHDALRAAGSAADPVLLDPRFGRWCAEMVNLIERGAPSLLPAGRFRAACRDAAAFTLAARSLHLQGNAGDVPVPDTAVRVDHEGRVRMPGTGWVLVPGLGHAGLDMTVSVRGGRFTRPGPASAQLAVEAEPVVLPGLAVTEGDPVDLRTCAIEPLLAIGPPSVVVERGMDDPRAAAVPGIARVPMAAGPKARARHALAAAAHLRAAAQGVRLFEPGTCVAEPPPDVAHLASAPQLIRFLALYGSQHEPLGVIGETSHTLRLLAGWLAAAGSLSPLGKDLLLRLPRTGGRPMSVAGPTPPVGQAGPRGQAEPTWRAAWSSAGGMFRKPAPARARLVAGHSDLALLLADLGAGEGIKVNSISADRARADPTIDQLSLLKARDPERYAGLVGRLAVPPRCLAEELLLSHQAYVEERFSDAAAGYADLLLRLPSDIDLWRDFAFSLRHLGATGLCETILFRLTEVVERAEECETDLAVLDRIHPYSSGWHGAPPAVRQLVGLIEWVSG